MATINLNKHIWEGWTVQSFIDELEPIFNQIMNNQSWQKPFKTKDELKECAKIINRIIKNIFLMLLTISYQSYNT